MMCTVLSGMPNLKELSLNHCTSLTAMGLRLISGLEHLERLSMESCVNMGGGRYLLSLTCLKELNLGCCLNIGNEDAIYMSQLTGLEMLNIRNTKIDSGGLLALQRLVHVKKLCISGLPVNDMSVATVIMSMPLLEDLDASRCVAVGGLALKALAENRYGAQIRRLNMAYTSVDDRALMRHLPWLKKLQTISLESCNVSESGLMTLGDVGSLRDIMLSDTRANNSTLEVVCKLPHLESLDISFTMVDDRGLYYISKSKSLKSLNIESSEFTDSGLLHICKLPRLEHLDLYDSRVTDLGCTYLANLKSLKSLEICGGLLTSQGVQQISRISTLEHLSLAHNHRISDAAIPALLNLHRLTSLNLSQVSTNRW